MRTSNILALLSASTLASIGFDAEAPSGGDTSADTSNTLVFPIPNAKAPDGSDVNISIDLTTVPAAVRLDMLKNAIKAYVTNSVNQENVRTNKKLEPWAAYEAASAADPLQTAVAKPEGERPTADLIGTATAARDRLYKGEIRKQGEAKPKVVKDPLVKAVTDVVTRELFDKKHAEDSKYKWTDAVKEIGGDGVAYMNARIATMVAAGGDKAALDKFMQDRYIKPAEMLIGRNVKKGNEGVSLL